MAEFPALTLWTDSYLADTRMLSTMEHGAYLLLLMEAWRRPHCDLPDDDKILARLAGLPRDEWDEIKPTIMGFWTYDGRSKTWHQKRLRKERDAARVRSKSAKDKAAKRWEKTKKADAGALPSECPDDASTATAIITEEEPVGSSSPPTPHHTQMRDWPAIPDWVPVEPWNAFIAMRKRKGGMPTARAIELILGKLERWRTTGQDPGAVLDQSTEKGWTGIFELKDDRRGTGNRTGQFADDHRDGFTRALHRDLYAHHAAGPADEPFG